MEVDFNSLVFGSASPQQQAQIANNLRNRELLGSLMAMTGAKELAPAGEMLVQGANSQRGQAINRQYYMDQMKNAQSRLAEQSRHNREMEGISRLVAQTKPLTDGAKMSEKALEEYGKKMQELNAFGEALSHVNDVVARYKGRNIPGLGGLSNTEMLGDITTALSPEAKENRAAFSRLFGQIAFMQGGKALTATEKDIIRRGLAHGWNNSDEEFLGELASLNQLYADKIATLQATYGGPDTAREYIQRGGVVPNSSKSTDALFEIISE